MSNAEDRVHRESRSTSYHASGQPLALGCPARRARYTAPGMADGRGTLRKTLSYVAVGVLGSAVLVGLFSFVLIRVARALLPASSAAPAAPTRALPPSEPPPEDPEPSAEVPVKPTSE